MLDDRLSDIPFSWYAANSFDYHTLHSGRLSNKLQCQFDQLLAPSNVLVQSILQMRSVPAVTGSPHLRGDVWSDFQDYQIPLAKGDLVYATLLSEIPEFHAWLESSKQSRSSLHRACMANLQSQVMRLLSLHPDPNVLDEKGVTPLYYVAVRGYEKLAAILLEKGAEVNAQGGHYGNALQAACFRGHEKVVAILLEKGAEVNAQGGDYGNAIQAACLEGHKTTIRLLIKWGANPLASIHGDWSPLEAAAKRGDLSVVELLLQGAHNTISTNTHDIPNILDFPESPGNANETTADAKRLMSIHGHALLLATSNGHMDVSRSILGANRDLEMRCQLCVSSLLASSDPLRRELLARTGRHSYHREGHSVCCCNVVLAAACSQNQSLLAMLLSFEGGIDSRSENTDVEDKEAAIRILQDLGRDIKEFTDAAERGESETLERMLSNLGVDVQDGCGWSALHRAAYGGHADIVRWLLEDKGADLHLRLVNGNKAIHCAAQRGNTDIVSLLLEKGSCVDERTGTNELHYTGLSKEADSRPQSTS